MMFQVKRRTANSIVYKVYSRTSFVMFEDSPTR